MKESYLIAVRLYEEAVAKGAPPDTCQCCGARVEQGLKGCFELFADLPLRNYGDGGYGGANFYGVDAHALQHPEVHGKKNNAAHLLRLHWIFSHGKEDQAGTVPRWWQQYLQRRDIPLLEPPKSRGRITVVDVAAARTGVEHAVLMRDWARSVYDAWGQHHAWAEQQLGRVFGG